MPLFATNFLLRAMYPVTYGGTGSVSFQGYANTSGTNAGTTQAVDISSLTPAYTIVEGDVLILITSTGQGEDNNIEASITGGTGSGTATEICDLWDNVSRPTNFYAGYYVCTGGETGVTFTGYSANTGLHRLTYVGVFSGVDTTTPLDVTSVTNSVTNACQITPADITPTTENALVVIAAGNSADDAANPTFNDPGDLDNVFVDKVDGIIRDGSIFFGTYSWESGTYSPSALTTPASTTGDSAHSVTIALRPAATGGGAPARTGSFDISARGASLGSFNTGVTSEGFWVNNEGTQLLWATGSNIREYSMSTPHDLTTMSLGTTHTAFGGQCWGMDFSPDGTRFAVFNQSKTMRIYDCSTPFDISTAVIDETSSGFGGTGTQAFGFTWLDANTFCTNVSGNMSFWTGAADYSLSGATQGSSIALSGREGGMAPFPDGSGFITTFNAGSQCEDYDCSTPYDASTAVESADSFSDSFATPKHCCFNYNGDYLYIHYSNSNVKNYYIGDAP